MVAEGLEEGGFFDDAAEGVGGDLFAADEATADAFAIDTLRRPFVSYKPMT